MVLGREKDWPCLELVLCHLEGFFNTVSSNIKCPPKRRKNRREKKSHGSRAIISFGKNQDRHGDSMGRTQLTLERHCKRSHFTSGERLELRHYHAGSNGNRKLCSPTILGKILQKIPKRSGVSLGAPRWSMWFQIFPFRERNIMVTG